MYLLFCFGLIYIDRLGISLEYTSHPFLAPFGVRVRIRIGLGFGLGIRIRVRVQSLCQEITDRMRSIF